MLRELDLLAVYDSSEKDIMNDLMVPLLSNSTEYCRGVGFFTSAWLRLAAQGLIPLVENGGIARILLSPILEHGDWEAFQLGEKARQDLRLKEILRDNIGELKRSLDTETRNCLAWLIADEVLDFRFAVPRPGVEGDYHDKVGVYIDFAGDVVAIHGSFNDSERATLNGEAFSVFRSWEAGQLPFVNKHKDRLMSLWERGNSQFVVYDIPDASRKELIRLRTSNKRPYRLPHRSVRVNRRPEGPSCPITLRDFQQTAIEQWKQADCIGILEMATGTGKTFTSLAAAIDRYQALGQLVVVVLVPYLHLLAQWARDCKRFGFLPVLCSGEHKNWRIDAQSAISNLKLGVPHACLLVVHNTAASDAFGKITRAVPQEVCMVIADEVHALGARKMRRALFEEAQMRLGLSATPQRWFDEEGTSYLMDYFGGVCFEYPLEEAIGTYLVPYEYIPVLAHLTASEEASVGDLTARIALLMGRAESDVEVEERAKMLLIERARIIGAATNKLPTLLSLLHDKQQDIRAEGRKLRDVLIYCAPGTHKDVLRAVADTRFRCHEFVHDVNLAARETILKQFASGDIQALVAIKCLDEGVDVPSTQTAFFLGSTTNPKEFIQRRGRVLRTAEGKKRAFLYDFIVVPSLGTPGDVAEVLLRREFPRFAEFSAAATNTFQARSVVRSILDRYEMLDLLDKRPWEVYHEQQALRSDRSTDR